MADSIAYGGLGHRRQRFFLNPSPRPRVGPWAVAECFVWLDSRYDVEKQDGRVFRWLDQSLRGESTRHVSQATVARRPDYIATDADFNNKPAFRFYNDSGGRDSWLKGASDMTPTEQPMTWYAVAAHDAGGGGPIFNCTNYMIATDDTETYATGDDEVVGTAVSANASHVFCLVKDSADVNLYVDDMEVANASIDDSSNNGNTGAPLLIGDDGNQSTVETQFSGRIAMVAGFEGAHTLEQRQTIAAYLAEVFVPSPFALFFGADLKHLWDDYEADTGIWTDRIGGANGTPPNDTPPEATQNAHVYPQFDANNNGIEGPDISTLDNRSSWTFFGAIKTNADGIYGGIITKEGQFYIEGDSPSILVTGYSDGELAGVTAVDDDQWHRFIATCTGNVAKLWIDGGLEDTDAAFNAFNDTSLGGILLGNRPGFFHDPFPGGILILGIATAGVDDADIPELDGLLEDWVGAAAGDVPVVTSVTQNLAPTAGGSVHELVGNFFTGTTAMTTGGTAVAWFVVVDDEHIIFEAPAHAVGASQSILVTNADGTNGANTLFEFWAPAELVATGLWDKGNYQDATAGTWPGLASAGSSSGRDLVQVTVAQQPVEEGLEPVFDGVDDNVRSTTPISTFFTAGAGTILALFISRSQEAASAVYDEPTIVTDTNARIGLTDSLSGVGSILYDGAGYNLLRTDPVAPNTLHAAVLRWGDGSAGLSVDGATEVVDASFTTLDLLTGVPFVGENYAVGKFHDGPIRTLVFIASKISDADVTRFLKWARACRGLEA